MTEDNMTKKDPVQLKSGGFGCPDCSTPLGDGLVPYYLNGNFLGSFDGQICPMCGFGLLSEKGYEDSGKAAKQRGQITKSLDMDLNGELSWTEYVNIQRTSNELANIPQHRENKSISVTGMEKYITSPKIKLTI